MSKKSDITLGEIQKLIFGFCDKYLNDEYTNFCRKLLNELNNETDISRGNQKNWAAGVVYAIARANFLFDSSSFSISPDIICDYFGVNKNTAGNKASAIRDICYLDIGDPDYCSKDVVDAFTFVEISEGFIVPKNFFNKISAIEKMSDEDMELLKLKNEKELLKQKEERILREKEEKLVRARKKKEKEMNAGQIYLFED